MNPTPDKPADLNVERLVSQAYHPEPMRDGFIDQVEQAMLSAAPAAPASPSRATAREAKPAVILRILRSPALAWSAAAAILVVSLFLGHLPPRPAPIARDTTPSTTSSTTVAGQTTQATIAANFTDPSRTDTPTLADRATRTLADALVAKPHTPSTQPVHRAQVGQTFQTAAAEKRRLVLPDGSILYLNALTRATLAADRQLTIDAGDAFLEVAPDSDHRFIVRTPTRQVVALGTRFGVSVAKNGTGVLVTQGKVRVTGSSGIVGGATTPADAELTAGRALASDGRILPAPRATANLDWMADLVAAANSPLVPASAYVGGALVVKDQSGQESRLDLRKYHVDVHIEDGFARTTIDQTYFNHQTFRAEGTFFFPLPPDASISRLAMYVEGKLMEGGMAERDNARAVYESIVHTRRDPALLEWVDGSTFKMRVFPLEGRQEKRIVISYVQRLSAYAGKTTYRFPQGHNLQAKSWSFHARVPFGHNLVWNSPSHVMTESRAGGHLDLDIAPQNTANASAGALDKDVVLTLHDDAAATAGPRFTSQNFEGHDYLMLRWRPELPSTLTRQRRDWVVLIESSAARDPVLARAQIDLARSIMENAEHDDTFTVLTAATRTTPAFPQRVSATPQNIAAAIRFLENTQLIGALDLAKGLDTAAQFCTNAPNPWLVHLGSGIDVMGSRREDELLAHLPANTKYVGIGVGKRWSRSFMKAAAARTGGYVTQVNPDDNIAWRGFEVLSTLNTPRLVDVKVIDPATEKIAFLIDTDSLAQGEELCAAARLDPGTPLPATVLVTGMLDGQPWKRQLTVNRPAANPGYLPRFWARIEIDRLLAQDSAANKPKIVELSKAMYVMSPFTSLLVLENDAMYQQFKIDRGRKDHWALYPCPEQIPVVNEPLPTSPFVIASTQPSTQPAKPQTADEKRRAALAECLASILVRGGPRTIFAAGQYSEVPTFNAQALVTGYPRYAAINTNTDWYTLDNTWSVRTVNGTMPFWAGDAIMIPSANWEFTASNYAFFDWSDSGLGRPGPFLSYDTWGRMPGQVVALNGGTLVLTGANTYSGATTITAGTLTINGIDNLILPSDFKAQVAHYRLRGASSLHRIDPGLYLTQDEFQRQAIAGTLVKSVSGYLVLTDGANFSSINVFQNSIGFNQPLGNQIFLGDRFLPIVSVPDGGTLLLGGQTLPGTVISNGAFRYLARDFDGDFIVRDDRRGWIMEPTLQLDGTDFYAHYAPHFYMPAGSALDPLLARAAADLRLHASDTRKTAGPVASVVPGTTSDNVRRTVSQLIERSQDQIRRRQYTQALGILQQILAVDPNNDYARGAYPLVRDNFQIEYQKRHRPFIEREFTNRINAAEERKIAYEDILRYPENWPDISELRDASIRTERGLDSETIALYAQLDRRLPEINFAGQGLADVIEFLRDISSSNIFVNWRALEAAGIHKDTPVTLQLKDVHFNAALNALVDHLASRARLAWIVDEGVITLSTADDLARSGLAAPWRALGYVRPQYNQHWTPFTDLLSYCPGFATTAADIAAVLERELPDHRPASGAIDPAARALIAKAATRAFLRIALPNRAGEIRINHQGHFLLQRTTPDGLRETITSDGRSLHHLYPDLGVGAQRPVTRFHRSQLSAILPGYLPPADDLAIGASLTMIGSDTIAIDPLRKPAASTRPATRPTTAPTTQPAWLRIELRFENNRLAERRALLMPANKLLCRQTYATDGVVLTFDVKGKEVSRHRVESSPCDAPQLAAADLHQNLVVLPMPWRNRSHVLTSRKLAEGQHAKWSDDDRLAMLAAECNDPNSNPIGLATFVRDAFIARGDHRLGLYTLLISRGVNWDLSFQQPTGGLASMDPIVQHPGSLLATYINRARRLTNNDFSTTPWPAIAPNNTDSPFLTRLTELGELFAFLRSNTGPGLTADARERIVARWASLLIKHKDSDLAWSLALWLRSQMGPIFQVNDAVIETSLAAAARRPADSYAARYEAARAMTERNREAQAREIFADLYQRAIVRGVVPAMDDDFYKAFRNTPDGKSQLAKLTRDSAKDLVGRCGPLAGIEQARQLRLHGEPALADELFEHSAATLGATPSAHLAAVRYLYDAGQFERAGQLVDQLLADTGRNSRPLPALWRLASLLAEKRGNVARAADLLAQAVEHELAALPESIDINYIRTPSAELLAKYEPVADALKSLGQSPPRQTVARIIRIADSWRALDPDPTQPCQAAARILRKLGMTDLAWDYLTTPLAQKSNEAQPWQNLAAELARQGDVDLADRAYATAFELEPTNAQALWDRAELLRNHGRAPQARPLYQKLVTGTWQPRFSNLQQQARNHVAQ